MNKTVKVYKSNENAFLPEYGTALSGCFDLKVCLKGIEKIDIYHGPEKKISQKVIKDSIVLEPGDRAVIPFGLIFEIPPKYEMKIYPRSSTGGKLGLSLPNNVGNIDNDYRDPLLLLLHNINISDRVTIKHGDRLAQAQFVKFDNSFTFVETKDRPEKVGDRSGGFGSTGK